MPVDDVLTRFTPATQAWFRGQFDAPTAAQRQAWQAISEGQHTLVVAPTGSGKTLSAFLWALDRLAAEPERAPACRVLYISPLKALATDVERNLRVPLAGIATEADRLGLPEPHVRVGVRTGDTPSDERRAFAKHPPDILITTPESLFLILTSAAREGLRGVETVIVDEIHAVAGTKRGAHLAVSLERLDALLKAPAQRIGLSATVRPTSEVARFLAAEREVAVVAPDTPKAWQLEVVVPVPDMADLEATPDQPERSTIWPHVEERIVDLIAAHRSTLVFANSRRLAERLTARINEIWWERVGGQTPTLGDGGFARRYQPNHDLPGAHDPSEASGQTDTHDPSHPTGSGGNLPDSRPRQSTDAAVGAKAQALPRLGHPVDEPRPIGGKPPAQAMGQSGWAESPPLMLARAHHGSVSREQRHVIEEDLKAGRLRAVVATSSLELGIDMGAIDLVIQVESPPSVASGLQRIGRAGHMVGATSHGVLLPKFPGDLAQMAVVTERMQAGAIEALRVPSNPLDVLAQQVVAMVAMDELTVAEVESVVRRAAPFTGLTRGVLESVLDMLAGRYPSDEFAELRPRLVWDRTADTLTPRRNAQRLAVTSGGTIPDRGLFGVFIEGESGPGRRVGELDEEMVYESRVGDIFALGTSTWRIEKITHDRVLVTPAPGQTARLPFWKGDSLGRPAELGQAVGAFIRELGEADEPAARRRLGAAGLDEWACDNLLAYLRSEHEAIGRLPHDRQIVVERSRDELGDWRVVVLSPYGARVHAPWALLAADRLSARFGVDVRAMHADDGMVFRLPDTGDDAWEPPTGSGGHAPIERPGSPHQSRDTTRPDTPHSARQFSHRSSTGWPSGPGSPGTNDLIHSGGPRSSGFDDDALLDALFPDPGAVRDGVLAQLGSSALFAARFRECAGRALLLPKRRPDQRQALWQQRLRASQLLQVASSYPSFPIVLEAVRECMEDVFDVPALVDLLTRVRSREVATVVVEAPHASPFASSLLFGYVAQFLYEGDAPLAERRAAALNLDPTLLADLLGTAEGLTVADLLDPDELTRTEAELQHLSPARQARDADELTDVLRDIGPLTTEQLARRITQPDEATAWLSALEQSDRVYRLGPARWAAIEDAGRLHDALDVPLPADVPSAFVAAPTDPFGELLARYARTHTPFTAEEVADWLGVGIALVRSGLDRLSTQGHLLAGDMRPPGWQPVELTHDCIAHASMSNKQPPANADLTHTCMTDAAVSTEQPPASSRQYCDERVLALLRRRSVAALRNAVEPVTPDTFARFLPAWHEFGRREGIDGVARTIEQLAGVPLPASAWETLVLPARVRDYQPAMLDELLADGEVVWQGHGAIGSGDGWISLHLADMAADTLVPGPAFSDLLDSEILDALRRSGAQFLRGLSDTLRRTRDATWHTAPPIDPVTGEVLGAPGQANHAPTAPDLPSESRIVDALWRLVWAGRVTNDTFTPVRALLTGGTTAHKAKRPTATRGRYGHRLRRPLVSVASAPARAAGRWSALPTPETDLTRRLVAWSELLLDRYGVVTRGAAAAEELPGGFSGIYRVLSAAEDQGHVRRGYFIDGLGAAQFAESGVIDRLRTYADAASHVITAPGHSDETEPTAPRSNDSTTSHAAHLPLAASPAVGPTAASAPTSTAMTPARCLVLAASDPANPYGATLPWPSRSLGHSPGRKAGALVVLADGHLVLSIERGARTVLTWTDDQPPLDAAARCLAQAVERGTLSGLTIEKVDGEPVFTSTHPLLAALTQAGFTLTPRGLRLRPPPTTQV